MIMTQEQKARAYDRAFEIAKKVHKYSSDLAEIKQMEHIFPELCESEDEKIRKEIIQSIKHNMVVIHKDDCLIWLEKQGTSYTKRDVDNAYIEGIAFAKTELEKQGQKPTDKVEPKIENTRPLLSDFFNAEYERGKVDALQSIEWSEEDESMYTRTLGILGKCYMGELPTKVEEELNWFKTLKERIGG